MRTRRLTPAQRRALDFLFLYGPCQRPAKIHPSMLRRLDKFALAECYFGDGPDRCWPDPWTSKVQGWYWYITDKGRRALADGFYEVVDGR